MVIIDEPFTALDPLNVQLVKDVMEELRAQGATIIMSTHQMQQVEELCDRIVLIDAGKNVLYGDLQSIRREFSGHAILVQARGELPRLTGVTQTTSTGNGLKMTLAEDTSPQDVLQALLANGVMVEHFEIAVPSLDEIFIRVVERSDAS